MIVVEHGYNDAEKAAYFGHVTSLTQGSVLY